MSSNEDLRTGIADVQDFATDWDLNDQNWTSNPYPIVEDLRARCPVAHTERFNEGVWMPLHYEDVVGIAHDVESFSSVHHGLRRGGTTERGLFPPINTDPPEHHDLRRVLLPFFGPKRIEAWRDHLTADCRTRVQAIVERGRGDAATDYSQHIPVGAIAAILGIDPEHGDRFRMWIEGILGVGANDADTLRSAMSEVRGYMAGVMRERRQNPGEDLVSHLVSIELDGRPLDDDTIERMLVLQLVAGIDTTWSSIGAALWHLAQHPDDRRRLVAEPSLIPTAVEELLRAYAPVNVMRRVLNDTEVRGVEFRQGDHVLMTYPIACRDPEVFERADEVVIDRAQNRHIAFGVGIHRCLGSNLARLEMTIAVETWLDAIPEYSLEPGAEVTWSTGQIRGPRNIPILVG